MLPLILGNMVGATGSGQYVTRTGRWKGIMLAGAGTQILGLCLLGTIVHTTPVWHLSVFMVLIFTMILYVTVNGDIRRWIRESRAERVENVAPAKGK